MVLLALALLLSAGATEAQPDTLWTRVYGGPLDDQLYGTCSTQDDGVGLLVVQSVTVDSSYAAVLRLDDQGDSLWSCRLPWSTATTFMFDGNENSLVVARQLFENLELVWISENGEIARHIVRRYPYAGTWRQFLHLGRNGFILRGHTGNPYYRPVLLRLDDSGEMLWTRQYHSEFEFWANRIISLRDGGFALLTYFGVNDQFDIRLFRLNAEGETLFDQTLGGEGSSYPINIWENNDGTFTMLAQWLAEDSLCFLQLSEEGELLSTSPSLNHSVWFGVGGAGAIRLEDESYLLWIAASSPWIAQVTGEGEILWRQDGYQPIENVILSPDGSVILATDQSNHYRGRFRNQDYWVIRLEFPPNRIGDDVPRPISMPLLSAWPNPCNSSVLIGYNIYNPGFVRLGVYNIDGRRVEEISRGYQPRGTGRLVWNAGGVPAGNYRILMTTPDGERSVGINLVK
jgi:hypothetical protein